MNYWFFTVTQKKIDGEIITAEGVLKQRLADGFWGLGERTPNRRYLQKGDQIVFYLGSPVMAFAASATLASESFALSDEHKAKYWHSKVYEAEYGVLLENIQLWEITRSVKDLVAGLKFIENKENWFAYFQGGVRQISEDDYRTIFENRKAGAVEIIQTEDAIISKSQFALEAHLEEFIDQNWKHINFGAELAVC